MPHDVNNVSVFLVIELKSKSECFNDFPFVMECGIGKPRLDFRSKLLKRHNRPWNTVIATRFSIQASLRDGRLYRNAGMQYARLRWGRIVEDHIYEDTQTLAWELQQMAHQGLSEAVVLPTSAR